MRMMSKSIELKLRVAYGRRPANIRPDPTALEQSLEKYGLWERCSLLISCHEHR